MSIQELLHNINHEDQQVPKVVAGALPQIESLVEAVEAQVKQGGRLFYIGAGTSGRLGIVDASEVPPTFGVKDTVIGIIAGGDGAIRQAVEHAEDDPQQAWKDLQAYNITAKDVLVGIAASGKTPYVLGGCQEARQAGLITGCITCNPDTPLAAQVSFPVEVVTGPEFLTGSTRMKAGTATKLVLNMLTTALMVRLGHVEDNKMVDMQLSNAKLKERGVQMLMEELDVDHEKAGKLLQLYGSVRKAIREIKKDAHH